MNELRKNIDPITIIFGMKYYTVNDDFFFFRIVDLGHPRPIPLRPPFSLGNVLVAPLVWTRTVSGRLPARATKSGRWLAHAIFVLGVFLGERTEPPRNNIAVKIYCRTAAPANETQRP